MSKYACCKTGIDVRTGGIEQSQCIRIFTNHDGDRVVIKDLGRGRCAYFPSKNMFIHTVGTYSLGNLFVVYDINKQVYSQDHRQSASHRFCQQVTEILTLPTAPSPTTTHLIVCISKDEVYKS